eukprot:gb/GEZN01000825.1/.p1 GENE.gb/GEZN01000825.1/~~gb/GEZN01000825.1/.p1  ORF type:complete len:1127 (-),score=189.08 gb/GEZN01000825.1/:233-3613(-)
MSLHKADWVKDEEEKHCMLPHCKAAFTFFERRHHCRQCGLLVCGRCSSHRRHLSADHAHQAHHVSPEPVRVCDGCAGVPPRYKTHGPVELTEQDLKQVLEEGLVLLHKRLQASPLPAETPQLWLWIDISKSKQDSNTKTGSTPISPSGSELVPSVFFCAKISYNTAKLGGFGPTCLDPAALLKEPANTRHSLVQTKPEVILGLIRGSQSGPLAVLSGQIKLLGSRKTLELYLPSVRSAVQAAKASHQLLPSLHTALSRPQPPGSHADSKHHDLPFLTRRPTDSLTRDGSIDMAAACACLASPPPLPPLASFCRLCGVAVCVQNHFGKTRRLAGRPVCSACFHNPWQSNRMLRHKIESLQASPVRFEHKAPPEADPATEQPSAAQLVRTYMSDSQRQKSLAATQRARQEARARLKRSATTCLMLALCWLVFVPVCPRLALLSLLCVSGSHPHEAVLTSLFLLVIGSVASFPAGAAAANALFAALASLSSLSLLSSVLSALWFPTHFALTSWLSLPVPVLLSSPACPSSAMALQGAALLTCSSLWPASFGLILALFLGTTTGLVLFFFGRVVRIHVVAFVVIFAYWAAQKLLDKVFKVDNEMQTKVYAELDEWLAPWVCHQVLLLRSVFVKFGQYLGSRADSVSLGWAKHLAKLQDDMPADSVSYIARTVHQELGRPIEQLFQSFDLYPLASASIAQVHDTTLLPLDDRPARRVALKIQHEGVSVAMLSDMVAFKRIVRFLVYLNAKRFQVTLQLLEAWEKEMVKELDFRVEADNLLQVGRSLRAAGLGPDKVLVPQPLQATALLFTMDYLEGIKITELAWLDRLGVDKSALFSRIVQAFSLQLLVAGQFNADPHPGNVFVHFDGPAPPQLHSSASPAAAKGNQGSNNLRHRASHKTHTKHQHKHKHAWVKYESYEEHVRSEGEDEQARTAAEEEQHQRVERGVCRPVLLDFGMVVTLTEKERLGYCQLVLALAEFDSKGVAQALRTVGYLNSHSAAHPERDAEFFEYLMRDTGSREQQLAGGQAFRDKRTAQRVEDPSSSRPNIDAFPDSLLFLFRLVGLLRGLATALGASVSFIEIMAWYARLGLVQQRLGVSTGQEQQLSAPRQPDRYTESLETHSTSANLNGTA